MHINWIKTSQQVAPDYQQVWALWAADEKVAVGWRTSDGFWRGPTIDDELAGGSGKPTNPTAQDSIHDRDKEISVLKASKP